MQEPSARRIAIAYTAAVGLPIAVLATVLRFGANSSGPRPWADVAPVAPLRDSAQIPELALLVAQIAIIVLAARGVGAIARRIGQPRVVGEIVAGILLGPSLLGWIAPGVSAALFPAHSFGVLNALSQLGLVLFMFLVGLELNWVSLRHRGPAAFLISHASIAAPMALGAVTALFLFPRFAGRAANFAGFALFMGAAVSITAFPVLARILTERKLLATPLGAMAIACAAINDVTGWCVVAYVVEQVRATGSAHSFWIPIAGLALFMMAMLGPARIALRGMETAYLKESGLSENRKAGLLVFLLLAALATEALGLHPLFGAFVAGAVMPRNTALISYLIEKFESLTVLLLLPIFFAYSGLRTNIGGLRGAEMWGACAVIVLVAVAGKIGGTGIGARLAGCGWRESASLGALMNTRGLMELVVLNIGLDIQAISAPLFSMMIVMALVTTAMTSPITGWLKREKS